MDTETVVQALPHIVLYFRTLESADEEWNKHYCEALLEAQKLLTMDKEREEIRQYHRVRCKKCLDFFWSKNKRKRFCPDCSKKVKE